MAINYGVVWTEFHFRCIQPTTTDNCCFWPIYLLAYSTYFAGGRWPCLKFIRTLPVCGKIFHLISCTWETDFPPGNVFFPTSVKATLPSRSAAQSWSCGLCNVCKLQFYFFGSCGICSLWPQPTRCSYAVCTAVVWCRRCGHCATCDTNSLAQSVVEWFCNFGYLPGIDGKG